MNRSLPNVILGGYEMAAKPAGDKKDAVQLVHQEIDVGGVCEALTSANKVIIVPGEPAARPRRPGQLHV